MFKISKNRNEEKTNTKLITRTTMNELVHIYTVFIVLQKIECRIKMWFFRSHSGGAKGH